MTIQNNTEDIFIECDKFRKDLSKAFGIVQKNYKKVVVDFKSSMKDRKKEISQLSSLEDSLQNRIIETTRHCRSHEDQIVNLEKLYTNLERERQILPVTLDNIEDKIKDTERELDLCKNEIKALEEEYKFKQDVICKEIEKYKKYMGIDIQIENRLLKIIICVGSKISCVYFEIGERGVLDFVKIEPMEYRNRLSSGKEISVSKLVKNVIEVLLE